MSSKYLEIAKKVKRIVEKYDKDAQVYLFGSVVEGKATPFSDIDIMIISQKREYEYKIKTEAYRKIDAPIEIHYITPDEYRSWYCRFVKKRVLIK